MSGWNKGNKMEKFYPINPRSRIRRFFRNLSHLLRLCQYYLKINIHVMQKSIGPSINHKWVYQLNYRIYFIITYLKSEKGFTSLNKYWLIFPCYYNKVLFTSSTITRNFIKVLDHVTDRGLCLSLLSPYLVVDLNYFCLGEKSLL